jgi:hypothetical protein
VTKYRQVPADRDRLGEVPYLPLGLSAFGHQPIATCRSSARVEVLPYTGHDALDQVGAEDVSDPREHLRIDHLHRHRYQVFADRLAAQEVRRTGVEVQMVAVAAGPRPYVQPAVTPDTPPQPRQQILGVLRSRGEIRDAPAFRDAPVGDLPEIVRDDPQVWRRDRDPLGPISACLATLTPLVALPLRFHAISPM